MEDNLTNAQRVSLRMHQKALCEDTGQPTRWEDLRAGQLIRVATRLPAASPDEQLAVAYSKARRVRVVDLDMDDISRVRVEWADRDDHPGESTGQFSFRAFPPLLLSEPVTDSEWMARR